VGLVTLEKSSLAILCIRILWNWIFPHDPHAGSSYAPSVCTSFTFIKLLNDSKTYSNLRFNTATHFLYIIFLL